MPFLRRNTAPPPTLPIHNGPSRVSSYLDWMATATSVIWTERDEWEKQYKIVKYSASEHNKPFVQVLRERNGSDCRAILAFMDWNTSCDNEIACVEAFCQGADQVLESDPGQQLGNIEEPKAWISDRNYWLLKDAATEPSKYGYVLGRSDFYKVLRNERFRESPSGEMVGPVRHLFVSNPDGVSVLAILKTANEFQAAALHDLLANYITTNPTPSISLEVSDFWNTSYVVSFTLPFYAIGRSGRKDKRTLHGKQPFRESLDLGFFDAEELRPFLADMEGSDLQGKLVLHQGVCSLSATGVTEEHWTAYCFDDDFFDSEPRLSKDKDKDKDKDEGEDGGEDEDEDEDDDEDSEECGDPIILEAGVSDMATQWRPRQYFLVALAAQLDRVQGHHARIHDVFKHSLDSHTRSTRDDPSRNFSHSNEQDWKKVPELLSKVLFYNSGNIKEVENFLKDEVQLNQAGVPQGMLWQSLRNDIKAIKALRAIMKTLKRLKRVGNMLEETKRSLKELRHEKELDWADQQRRRDERAKEFAIAAVFAILTLIAEVYNGKPQKGDEASWPGYIFLVALFSFICIAGILYMLRTHIPESMKKTKGFINTKRSALRNSQVAVMLIQFACYIYTGMMFVFWVLKRRQRREEQVLPI